MVISGLLKAILLLHAAYQMKLSKASIEARTGAATKNETFVGEAQGKPFYVTEFCNQHSLSGHVQCAAEMQGKCLQETEFAKLARY